AVDAREGWAVKFAMEHIIGLKNEETKAAPAAKNKGLNIHFVRSPLSGSPIDPPLDFDLTAGIDYHEAENPPPLPAYTPPGAPPFPPNHVGKFRTEMDDPNAPRNDPQVTPQRSKNGGWMG